MKSKFTRRSRRSWTSSTENSFFKKEGKHEHVFFDPTSCKAFFRPAAAVQRKCEKCEEDDKKVHRMTNGKEEEKKIQRQPDTKEEKKKLLRKETDSSANTLTSNYYSNISEGENLPKDANDFYSSRMEHDFSDVKIHTGKAATASANNINARAFTIGNNIVFKEGEYNPSTNEGKKLLAHELTHVIQQQSVPKTIARQKTVAESKGIDTDDDVSKKMPSAIDLMFAASRLLTKFFPKGIKKIDSKGKFQIKIGYANLKIAYKECYGHELSEDTTIGGFYCRKTDTIYTVAGSGKEKSSTFGDVMHEAIHKISTRANILGSSFIDEGVTQYFADLIMAEQKMDKYTRHQYKDQLECATNIARLAGQDILAEEFFQNKKVLEKKLNEIFKDQLAKDHHSSVVVYIATDIKKFCGMLKAKN